MERCFFSESLCLHWQYALLLLLAYKNPYFIYILEERKKEKNNEITIVNENSDESVELLQKDKKNKIQKNVYDSLMNYKVEISD